VRKPSLAPAFSALIGTDMMISTRSVGLLIDTVVCLTLAKWETVSGRFRGYLKSDAAEPRLSRRLSLNCLPIGNGYSCAHSEK
jgi:hypothetical protein